MHSLLAGEALPVREYSGMTRNNSALQNVADLVVRCLQDVLADPAEKHNIGESLPAVSASRGLRLTADVV